MADLDFVIIVGRFGIPIEDGEDPDDDPDMIWCNAGEISLEPLIAETKVVGGLPVPWTGGQSTFTPTIDADGYSTWRGKHFIKAIDLTSTKVNPRIADGKATHRVTFRNVTAGVLDVKFEMRSVRLSADMAEPLDAIAAAAYGLPEGTLVCDLTKLLPVPVANSVSIVVGPQGTGITDLVQPSPTTMALTLSTGETTEAIELPTGPGGSDAGVAGYLGSPTSATSTALATQLSTTGSPAEVAVTANQLAGLTTNDPRRDAVDARVGVAGKRTFADSHGLYLPAPLAGSKHRRKRQAVLAGVGREHFAIVSDSQAAGAASTGNTAPKYLNCWVGRMIASLKQRGLYGGGWTFANADTFANPTWDPRWTFGAGVTAPSGTAASGSFGWHRSGTFMIPPSGYIEFTDTADSFQIFTGTGASGLYTVAIDGSTVGTVGNGTGVGTIAKVGGYAPGQSVTSIISAGTLGAHTIRITAPAAAPTYLLGVKTILSGEGKIEVSNASYNGKSLFSLFSASTAHRDEVNGLYGLPMIDFLKSDLLVLALGINDWQFAPPNARTLTSTLVDVASVLARQTTSGNAPTGAPKANGDAMLLWYPEPDNALGQSPQTWAQWREGWYAAADTARVPLLDLGMRFGGYASGVAAGGLFADTIHRTDAGSLDELAAIYDAIMVRI